jgi:hypothetical protein
MRKKINTVFFSFLNRIGSRKITFPLENINNIAIRPSVTKGEILYSLPLIESLSKKHKVAVFLPEERDAKYFRRLRAKIIRYPENSGIIGVYRLKKRIKDTYDLFIDLNEKDIKVFSYVLNNPIVASIFDKPGINITARAETKDITGKYEYLIGLLGFPPVKWKTKAIRSRRSKNKKDSKEIIGMSSDIPAKYHGLEQVSNEKELRKTNKLITNRNDLSTIAFFLDIPQVLLLEEKDPFRPPETVKVVRYSRKITPKIIGDCVIM